MSAVLVALAEALAAAINAHDFNTAFGFEAERSWGDADEQIEELDELLIDVVPAGYESTEPHDRSGGVHFVSTADIILRYKFPPTDTTEGDGRIDQKTIDALANLTDLIIIFLHGTTRLTNYDSAIFKSLEPRAVAPRDRLRSDRMFLAILRVSYHVFT
jgi:hypothetical protein